MEYDIDYAVTLDDGKEYYLIDKTVIDGDTYFYAAGYNKDVEKMIDTEKLFFKDDGGKLTDVTDLDLIMKLKKSFLEKVENLF